MVELQGASVVLLIIKYLLSAFISICVLILLLVKSCMHGSRNVFGTKPRPRPTALDDARFGTHCTAILKTVKLHYVTSGVENGPLMLFIHGFPEAWYSWRHQLVEFSKDYRVVAFDMRGYGESEKPTKRREYGLDRLTDDICELITFLGYKKAVVVCHDWGGLVGWSFTMAHPEFVEKLVVCNCSHPITLQKFVCSANGLLREISYLVLLMPRVPELFISSSDYDSIREVFVGERGGASPGKLTDEDVEVYKYCISQPGALKASVDYYRALTHYGFLDIDKRQKITLPVLLVWGDRDAFLHKELAEMSKEYCTDFRLVYVPGASHWVEEEEHEKVNEIIRGFLATDV